MSAQEEAKKLEKLQVIKKTGEFILQMKASMSAVNDLIVFKVVAKKLERMLETTLGQVSCQGMNFF